MLYPSQEAKDARAEADKETVPMLRKQVQTLAEQHGVHFADIYAWVRERKVLGHVKIPKDWDLDDLRKVIQALSQKPDKAKQDTPEPEPDPETPATPPKSDVAGPKEPERPSVQNSGEFERAVKERYGARVTAGVPVKAFTLAALGFLTWMDRTESWEKTWDQFVEKMEAGEEV